MRSIGNDIKSSSSTSSITQAHLDDLDEARDAHQAAAIATQSQQQVAYEFNLRVVAKEAADLQLSTAIAELNTYQNNARAAGLADAVNTMTLVRNAALAAAVTAAWLSAEGVVSYTDSAVAYATVWDITVSFKAVGFSKPANIYSSNGIPVTYFWWFKCRVQFIFFTAG